MTEVWLVRPNFGHPERFQKSWAAKLGFKPVLLHFRAKTVRGREGLRGDKDQKTKI